MRITFSEGLQLLLRPIVRYCLRHSHTIQEFTKVLELTYVEEAEREILRTAPKITIRRLSLMTGLRRPIVSRIYETKDTPRPEGQKVTTQITGRWEQDKRFTTKANNPRVLSYKEVVRLVKIVSSEAHPGTVLFELQRLGAVEKTRNGYKLITRSPRYNRSPRKSLELLSRDIHGLISAVEENMAGTRATRNLHLSTLYNNVYLKDLPKIRKWLLREGSRFHKKARDFVSRHDKDLHYKENKDAGAKVGITAFSYVIEE